MDWIGINLSVEFRKTRIKQVQIYISPTNININQSSSYLGNTYLVLVYLEGA